MQNTNFHQQRYYGILMAILVFYLKAVSMFKIIVMHCPFSKYSKFSFQKALIFVMTFSRFDEDLNESRWSVTYT